MLPSRLKDVGYVVATRGRRVCGGRNRSYDLGVLDDLAAKKPRDGAGARSANRFTYQVDWAFSKLIEMHKAKQDYLIVLDLHDDVVITDSETAPTRIDFFQVKTSTAELWDEKKLLRRTRGGLSILGKLYSNFVTFPTQTRLLGFISNVRCDLSIQEEFATSPEVFVGHLKPTCRKRILAQIRKEHKLASDPDCDQSLQFVLSSLHVLEHSSNVRGLLSEYVDTIHSNYPVGALYRTIHDLMRKRNDCEVLPRTVPELLAKKAIGRAEVQSLIDRMTPLGRYAELWTSILPDLQQISMGARRSLRAAWNRYAIERQNGANESLHALRAQIVQLVQQVGAELEISSPQELFDAVIPHIKRIPKPYEGDYLRAAILLEFNDDGSNAVPTSDQKPTAGAA